MKRSGAKKIIMTFIVLALAAVNLNNCAGGSGGGSTTSLSSRTNVAINIGQTRSLSAHSKGRFVRQTSAIPPAVVSIRLTISAPDMNPLQQLIDVAGRSSVSLSFELQNGQNREFVAEALDASNNVLYRGEIFANLNGTPLHLTIVMVSVDPLPPVFAGLSGITDITETSMQLSWSPASDEVTPQEQIVYLIFLSTTPQGITGQAASTPPSYVTDPGATTFTVTGLIPDTEYFVQVLAMDQKGNRDNNTVIKNARTKPTPDTTPPTFGGLVSATALSESQIELKWDAASDNKTLASEIEYLIYMSVTPGFTPGEGAFATPKSIVTGVTSTTIAGLDPNTTYYFKAWARDKAGNVSKNDVEKSAKTPDTTPPSAPTGLTATAFSSSQIDLLWTASSDNVGVVGYKVYRNGQVVASSKKSAAIAIAAITTTNYSDTGLTPNTQYCYQVTAYDAANSESPLSNQVCTMTQAAPPTPDTTPPSVPTGLTATAFSSSQINLAWDASTDNVGVTGYKVYRNGAATPIQTLPASPTSTSDTGLNPSTEYCYSLSAVDAVPNESAKSGQACATTLAAPPPPSGDTTPPAFGGLVSATPFSLTFISLVWNPASDNVTSSSNIVYLVYLSTTSGGENFATPSFITFPGATFSLAGGLTPGTTYYFVVRARDEAGNVDTNTIEKSAKTLPLSVIDLFPGPFYDSCSPDGCAAFDVHNGGTVAAHNVQVYALNGYFGSPTGCQGFFSITTIPAGGFVTLATSLSLFQDFYIIVDPNNFILESDKSNNTSCSGTFCTSPPIWPSDFSGCF